MKFWLAHTFVRSLSLEFIEGASEQAEGLKFKPVFSDGRASDFAVAFEVSLSLQPNAVLHLEYLAVFNTEDAITEEFKNSHFPRANAPAVAYPYVRAFVSQFTSLAGFDKYTLPIRSFASDARPPTPTKDTPVENRIL